MSSTWERETQEARSRAFEPLHENSHCGLNPYGGPKLGVVYVRAREWRLRRAVELLEVAGDVGVAQAMLAGLVWNPRQDSTLFQDLRAIGAVSSLELRRDRRGAERQQRIWRLSGVDGKGERG